MPDVNGLEAAVRAKEAGSTAAVVFLTVHHEPEFLEAAWAAGALGYVRKSHLASDLIPAIRAAVDGRRFVSASLDAGNGSSAASVVVSGFSRTRQRALSALDCRFRIAAATTIEESAGSPPRAQRTKEQWRVTARRQVATIGAAVVALLIPCAARAQTDLQLWGNFTFDWIKDHRITMGVDAEPKVLL